MKPILFFYNDHLDCETIELLNDVLADLVNIGYRNICLETFLDLDKELSYCESTFIKYHYSDLSEICKFPHAAKINALRKTIPYDCLFQYSRGYYLGKKIRLLESIKKIPALNFWPIDSEELMTTKYVPLSSQRNNFMFGKLAEVIGSNANSGIIVSCGNSHYKIEAQLKKQFPLIPTISFCASHNNWQTADFLQSLKNANELFLQEFCCGVFNLKYGQQKVFFDPISKVRIFGLKIREENSQRSSEIIKEIIQDPHQLLIKEMAECTLHPADMQTLQNREYGKFLRTICNNGREKPLRILLEYRSLIPSLNPDEKNKDGLSARDYAQRYAKQHRNEGPTAFACINLINVT
jgi:hypothetical protein